METISEMLRARAGRRASGAGRGRADMVMGRRRRPVADTGGAGGGAARPEDLRTSASCSTTCPSSASGSGPLRSGDSVVVGGNPNHRGDELARDISHTECQLLVTDLAHLPLVEGLDLGPGIGEPDQRQPACALIDSPGYDEQRSGTHARRCAPAIPTYLLRLSATSSSRPERRVRRRLSAARRAAWPSSEAP